MIDFFFYLEILNLQDNVFWYINLFPGKFAKSPICASFIRFLIKKLTFIRTLQKKIFESINEKL